ncbi:MAG: hypothetical protein JWO56_1867 [Acidobacteria bacterium]|nr:hypothetical protein [Acidobacteriota bacterium]
MQRRLFILTLLLTCSALPLFARGNLTELTVPLKFVPQEGVQSNTADLPPALLEQPFELRVEDARKLPDPLVIGKGTGGNDKSFPIHADREVRAYLQETLASIATDWSLKPQTPARRVLVVHLTGFSVDEANKALGSIYTADVKLGYTLRDAGGRTLASGVGAGNTHRYGHAHSPDNINEVLSDALKEAWANVLGDSMLQTAWISGKPSGSPSAAAAVAAPAESVEERLRKLDDLLKKKLITKEEYDRKRAEIMKDL